MGVLKRCLAHWLFGDERDELKQRIAELGTENAQLRDTVATLEEELEACRKENGDLQAQVDQFWQRFGEEMKVEMAEEERREYEKQEQRLKLEQMEVSELDLDCRAFSGLRRKGIETVAQLLDLRISDILRARGIGEGSAAKIAIEVYKHGWHFAHEQDDYIGDCRVRRILDVARGYNVSSEG